MAKLIKKIEYEFTEEDFKDLSNELISPCIDCGTDPETCCGCSKHSDFKKKMEYMESKNLSRIKADMNAVQYYYKRAVAEIEYMKSAINDLPDEVVEHFEFLKKAEQLINNV